MVITGERSNTIKAFFGFVIFIFFLDFIKLKIKISLLIFLSGLLVIIILSFDYLKLRYKGQFYDFIYSKETRDRTFENNIYIKLYKSGFNVFKNKPFLEWVIKTIGLRLAKKFTKNLTIFAQHIHIIFI